MSGHPRQNGRWFALLLGALFLLSPAPSRAETAESRFGRVEAAEHALFAQFNERIDVSRFSYLRERPATTLIEEVGGKMDIVVKQVEVILEMWPEDLQITLRLLPSIAAVQEEYRRIYHRRSSFLAFFSPQENAIFIAAPDITLGVLAHEAAHAVMHRYFGVAPSVKIHEVLAQMVETEMLGEPPAPLP